MLLNLVKELYISGGKIISQKYKKLNRINLKEGCRYISPFTGQEELFKALATVWMENSLSELMNFAFNFPI